MAEKARLAPAALAGFELIGRQPLAVLVWCLITFALTAAPMALVIPGMFDAMLPLMHKGLTNPGAMDEGDFPFRAYFSMMAVVPLTLIGYLFVAIVVFTAVWRAVLFPDQSRWAYLRFGRAEGRTFVILLILLVLFYMASMIPSMLVMFPIMMGFMAKTMQSVSQTGSETAFPFDFIDIMRMEGTLIACGLAVTAALAWPFARLAIALPMSLAQDRLRVFEGWKFTRGYGWRLWGMLMAVWLGVGLVQLAGAAGILYAEWGAIRPSFNDTPGMLTRFEGVYHAFRPWFFPAVLVFSLFSTLTLIIRVAPLARAYQLIEAAPDAEASRPA